jgi:crotonobetainyl-CoA:carnitine CoA-transferase CaiB-like acyl-CoA transferase
MTTGPLQGLRIIELGTLIAAPFAARFLAEFGADVIKIEPPGAGDPLRVWRKMHGDTSIWWHLQSRNKKSVAINLKTEEGQQIVRELVADADVLIENFRPGAMEKWNLGWETLSAINPKLTMVRISGYGQTGPYRNKPGFGAVGEAMGGLRYTTGEPDRPPSRMGVSIGDTLASLHGVIGALMSVLHVKANGGPGQVVDVSLYESVFNVMESLVPEYDLFGHVRERSGGALPGICPSNIYPTSDARFVVVAGNGDSIFKRLMRAIGREDMADEPALADNAGRVGHSARIDEAIGEWTRQRTLADAIAHLTSADVPCGPIYNVADIVDDPHYQARDMILDATLPDGTQVKFPGVTPKLSATPGGMRWTGPKLGEHTDDVLRGVGADEERIAALRAKGVIA